MFLDLHIDPDAQIAFKRQAVPEGEGRFPTLLHDIAHTREETILLIFLRQRFRSERADGADAVLLDREELLDAVTRFRPPDANDRSGDARKVENAILSLQRSGILLKTADEQRLRVAPVIEVLLPLPRLHELLDTLLTLNGTAPADDTDGAGRTAELDLDLDERPSTPHQHRTRPRLARRSRGRHRHDRRPRMNQPTLLPDPTGTSETQWIAESMQLVNWGGFHGHTLIELDPEATLLSGASGTGKSTILDGYLALMMPSDTPFNGASNDAAGRARNPEQRNLLTYLRGKIDDSRETGTGALTDKVLRGIERPHLGRDLDDLHRRHRPPAHGAARLPRTARRCRVQGHHYEDGDSRRAS